MCECSVSLIIPNILLKACQTLLASRTQKLKNLDIFKINN